MTAFNHYEEIYRGSNYEYEYPILGIATGLCGFFGAVYANVYCKQERSTTRIATLCSALTLPLTLLWTWQVRQKHQNYDYKWVLVLNCLNCFGVGGLSTCAAGYIAKQCTTLTRGLQFGYFALALASWKVLLLLSHSLSSTSDLETYTAMALIISGAGTIWWYHLEEN